MSTAMILSNLAIGPLLLILSLIFKVVPPKNRNWLYGYRTARAMKSEEAWQASNNYSTNLMVWIAIITITCQVITYLLFDPATALLSSCLVMCILLIGIIVIVERYLEDNFDSEGKPKK